MAYASACRIILCLTTRIPILESTQNTMIISNTKYNDHFTCGSYWQINYDTDFFIPTCCLCLISQ